MFSINGLILSILFNKDMNAEIKFKFGLFEGRGCRFRDATKFDL